MGCFTGLGTHLPTSVQLSTVHAGANFISLDLEQIQNVLFFKLKKINNLCTTDLDGFEAYCMSYCNCVHGRQKAASRPLSCIPLL